MSCPVPPPPARPPPPPSHTHKPSSNFWYLGVFTTRLTCSAWAHTPDRGTEQQGPQQGHFPAGTGRLLHLDVVCLQCSHAKPESLGTAQHVLAKVCMHGLPLQTTLLTLDCMLGCQDCYPAIVQNIEQP